MPLSPATLVPAMSTLVKTTALRDDQSNAIITDSDGHPILED